MHLGRHLLLILRVKTLV